MFNVDCLQCCFLHRLQSYLWGLSPPCCFCLCSLAGSCCVWGCYEGTAGLCPAWWGYCLYYGCVWLLFALPHGTASSCCSMLGRGGHSGGHPLASSPGRSKGRRAKCGQKSETVLLTGRQELSCIGCEVHLCLRDLSPSITTFLGFNFRKPVFHPVLWTPSLEVTKSSCARGLRIWCKHSSEKVAKYLGRVWR